MNYESGTIETLQHPESIENLSGKDNLDDTDRVHSELSTDSNLTSADGEAGIARGVRYGRTRRLAGALACCATATVSTYLLSTPEEAHGVVKGNISEFRNGVAAPPAPGVQRIRLKGYNTPAELGTDMRQFYLRECTYSETQNQFNDKIRTSAGPRNDNAMYVKITELVASKSLINFQIAQKAAKKVGVFDLDVTKCRRPAWIPYVGVRQTDEDKLKNDIKKAGCNLISPEWQTDKIWALNPQLQNDSGFTVFDPSWLGFDKIINIPICFRTNRYELDKTRYFKGWTREYVPPAPTREYLSD